MTNTIKVSILSLCLITIVSCSKRDDHSMWLSIKNETKYTINCDFYPTKTASGFSLGAVIDTIGKQDGIYSSDDENQKPTNLLISAYDSIVVTITGVNKKILLKKDGVKNYKLNPYTDGNSWTLKKITRDFPTNTSENLTQIDNYIFSIKMDMLSE